MSFIILIIFLLNPMSYCSSNVSILPPIFHLDDYTKCRQNYQHYCHITIELLPLSSDNNSEIWSLIEFTKQSYRHYDHNRLHYGICVENRSEFGDDNRELVVNLESYYRGEFEDLALNVTIPQIDCNNYDNIYTTSLYDLVVLYLCVGYFLLLTGVTLYHFINLEKSAIINKYLLPFSLINNYRKLVNSVDNGRLKYIQGIRFYTQIFIVIMHTYVAYNTGFVENTQYIEDIPNNLFKYCTLCLFMFLVQSYFLLTGWFLAYNFFQNFGKSNAKRYIFFTLINRYLRIGTTLGVILLVTTTTWYYRFHYGPLKHKILDPEYQICREYWWMNLLFINNQYSKPVCYVISWYLSVDTQLYVLSMGLLVIIWRYQRWFKTLIMVPIFVSILTQIIIVYRYNFDIIFRLLPKQFSRGLTSEAYFLYMATYLHMPTVIIGVTFGYFHYKYGKNSGIYRNNIFLPNWWLFFIGLPLLTTMLSIYKYNRLISALISAISRPIYALGVGIGIFGMLYDDKSVIKRILEWKPAVFLGSITFSTYLSHFLIVMSPVIRQTSPKELSDWIFFSDVVQNIFVCFLIGFFVFLTIESPTLQLQKLLLPKVKID